MLISPELRWLKPYVELAMPYLPRGKVVTRIGAWKIGGRAGKEEHAAILTNDGRNYRIYLHTQCHPRHSSKPLPFSRIDLLQYLAHEMAHMTHMPAHTPAHKRLEAKLTIVFMRQLEREGYVSEEKELA